MTFFELPGGGLEIEAIFDGDGNHLGGLFPRLHEGNAGIYLDGRPVGRVLGDLSRQRPGLFWFMLPLPTEAGLGALVSALDRGDVVVLYAATPEMIDAVCAEAAPLIGPGGHA